MNRPDKSDSRKPFSPADSIGDILGKVVKKEGLDRNAPLKGRRLAQTVLKKILGDPLYTYTNVVSVKTGIVTIEVESAALFQELEGFRRDELLDGFREADLKVSELRVRLARNEK